MKKLFVSCPMNGRTEENIRKSIEKMHAIAELIFDEKLEVIPTYISHKPPKNVNESMWYLGESIKKMAKADYFIGTEYSPRFKGCYIEEQTASEYGIPSYTLKLKVVGEDAFNLDREWCYGTVACEGNKDD